MQNGSELFISFFLPVLRWRSGLQKWKKERLAEYSEYG